MKLMLYYGNIYKFSILFKNGEEDEVELVVDKVLYAYTNEIQNIELKTGTYTIECFGARGGNGYGNSKGGYGGYVSGDIVVDNKIEVLAYIGQAGQDGNTRRSSFNGGAIGGSDTYGGIENGGSGGGATDIRLNNNIESRIMVAGGGGGAGGWINCNGNDGGLNDGVNTTLGVGTIGPNAQAGGGRWRTVDIMGENLMVVCNVIII